MKTIQDFVQQKLGQEPSGHDFLHAMRVYQNAQSLLSEDMDKRVILASALIHDCIDPKLDPVFRSTPEELTFLMKQQGLTNDQIAHVFDIIENMSFSKGRIPSTLEGRIVQDADRLDALGAIGIARAFSYGGKQGRLIYDPSTHDGTDTVSHFYQKLLRLTDLMNTEQGRIEAKKRTEFMKQYLLQLNGEVTGLT